MLRRILSLTAISCLHTGILCWSQETRATIVGRVTDATGAVVPNAEVQVANQAMGTTVTQKTNGEGLYTAPLLIPGLYTVTVTATGFKKFVRENIQLRIADRLEVNATIEVGGIEQSVTVSGAPELTSTETASMGTVVNSRQIMDLPLSYGNPFLLMGGATGTTYTGSTRLDRPFEPTHIANYAMDGTRGIRSDITIDGAPATATANAFEVIASYVPPTDILAEFKVQTSTFDAAVGNTEGGVTNLSIKSGTNQFHGTGYYSWTRKNFWANDFFNNRLGKDRPDFSFNRWGGSIGGPVWIPKLYNGKNKTFFLFGEEGIHDSRPRYDSTTPTVPTPAMKNGDFSALLAPAAGGQSCVASTGYNCYQIFNPFTRRAVSGGRFQEDPFINNIIDPQLFNPVGKAILDKFYPAPTSPANPDGTNNLLKPDLAEKAKYYNYTARVDENISERQRMYVRFSAYRRDSTYNDYFQTLATGVFFQFFSQNAVADYTFVLTPRTVLDFRYGYNRFIRAQDGNQGAVGFDLTQLGFPASYNALIPAATRRFPRIDLTGYIGTGFAGEYRPIDTHSFSTSITRMQGAHSLRAGVDWRAYRENDVFFGNNQTGQFVFDGAVTKGPLDNASTSPGALGQSAAQLLLGIPSASSSLTRSADYAEQSMIWGFYFQDDWKVTSRLTLNLGLRWEFETPLTERYNRSVQNFDPAYVQPFAAAAQAAYAKNPAVVPADQFNVRGGLTFAGVNGAPRGLYSTPKRNLLPRFGFAYQLQSSTVLRGGFGIYDGFLGQRRGDVIQTGFSRTTTFTPFAADQTTIINTLSNPWPNGVLEPVGAAQGYQTNIGQNISFYNQRPGIPNNYRWTLGLQHQLGRSILLEAAYVGNKEIRIEINRNINALPNQYLSTLPVRDNMQNSYLTASVPNPFVGLTPTGTPAGFATNTTIARQQLLLPFPEFGMITTTTNQGYSWYHSLQLRAEKRFSKGLSMEANYTYSKFMAALDYLNAADPAPTRMISDADAPHRIAMNWIYQLPFGKGHRRLSSSNGFFDRIAGGWEVSGVWALQSGFPLGLSGDYFLVADPSTAVLPIGQRTPERWFNTTPFVTVSIQQPVSHLRVNPIRFSGLRGPRINNVDFALIKDTRITEGTKLRFSVQALNALNHPYLPNPNLTFTTAQFGTINASTQSNYPRRLQLEMKFIF